jgi:hypothetical protein
VAVSQVSVTAYTVPAAASSKTQSLTISSGSARAIICTVAFETNSRSVSSIVFNGSENFTKKSEHSYTPSSGPVFRTEIWYLLNPTVTTANAVISISGGTARFAGAFHYCTGVDSTTPLGTAVTSGASTANPSVTVSDGTTGDLVIDILSDAWGSATAGAGQTQHYYNTLTNYGYGGSSEAGASSVTMSWTLSASERHLVAINIKADTASSVSRTPTVGASDLAGVAGRMDLGIPTRTTVRG